jgi:hypothetical protein
MDGSLGLEVDYRENQGLQLNCEHEGLQTTQPQLKAIPSEPIWATENAYPRRILGLSVRMFWLMVAVIVIVIAGGVGGGVAGGLAAQKKNSYDSR